ncbi:hypothetical protein F5Y16DRAFT_245094 [Xylariaceae sp. FL0255]|nr:hypothetical protein F5Y16DRAFT_245094 [Xylariaceae sp. FL0255]
MSSTAGDAPAHNQRVPAWKRLGLKLKPASEAQNNDVPLLHSSTSTAAVPNNRALAHFTAPNNAAKRKASSSAGAPALDYSVKRPKQDNRQPKSALPQNTPTPKKAAKSVSFSADTAGEPSTPVPAATNGAAAKKKKVRPPTPAKPTGATAKAPAKQSVKRSAPINLEPALAYLRTWHKDRANWKFNKNHQTKLLEQVFAAETTIPTVDIAVFYEYISGLKGGVRTRLLELANGVKVQDMEQGAEAFTGSNQKEMAERKQKEYEEVIKMFLGQPRTVEKRRFDEMDYVLRTPDMEMQRRVVKRMRAEMVIEELCETDESETPTTATTTSLESASTAKADTDNQAGQDGDGKRLKLNDGSQQRVKRKRKVRTAAIEDDTSSESDSEDESDSNTSSSSSSSSNSSSSGDSDDDDAGAAQARNDADTSSSSSSSSESESEEDSDDEEDDE